MEKNKLFHWKKERYLELLGLLLGLLALISLLRLPEPREEDTVTAQSPAMRLASQGDVQEVAQAPLYTIEATVAPDTGDVGGQMTLRYTNVTGEPLAALVFRLYANASAIYGGGFLRVEEVTRDGDVLETGLAQRNTVLNVPLEPPLEPGDAVTLDFAFATRAPYWSGLGYGIHNRARGVLALAGWYPVLARYEDGWQTPPIRPVGDAMVAQLSLYEVTLTAPAGYAVASTGTLAAQDSAEGQTTFRLISGPAWEFAVALSDRFEMHTTQMDDVTIRFFALPLASPVTPATEALEIAAQAFAVYEQRFGPYPFNELDIVDAAVYIGGYEFPGMVYVEAGKRASGTSAEYDYLLAHEVAHQWWYAQVGARPVEEPWLDEAFATYAVALYREQTQGNTARENLVDYWEQTATARPLDSATRNFGGWGSYRRTVYERGAVFLDSLRQEMGDAAFFELLRVYQGRMRYRAGTTEAFLSTAEEVAGRDLTPFFAAWFDAVGEP